MRTARTLTEGGFSIGGVSIGGVLHLGGVSILGGLSIRGGPPSGGVYHVTYPIMHLMLPAMHPGIPTPPVDRQTPVKT